MFTYFIFNICIVLNAFYYNIEEKDKDEDEDEEREKNFNKKASTHECMQTSSPIGRPEQQRSCLENRSERILPRDWQDSSSDSEDDCDMRTDGDFLYLIVCYMFLVLQSCLWWFFTSFTYNYE